MRGWWLGALLVGVATTARAADGSAAAPALTASVAPAATSPFRLLEGTEVARSAPLRDLAWHVYGYALDGSRLLAVGPDGAVLLDERGGVRARFECPQADGTAPTDVSLAGDNSVAAVRYANGRVCAWEGDGSALLGAPGGDATAVAVGGARMVVLGHADGRLEGRDPRGGGRKWMRNPDLGPIVHLRWEAKGPRVAASTGQNGVAVIDSRSGRLVRALRGSPAYAAAFDRTGRTLAVGRGNGRVEIWDTTQWYLKTSFKLSAGNVVDLDFSPDGSTLAAAIERTPGGAREVVLEVWDFKMEDPIFREVAPAGPGPTRFRYDALGDRIVVGNGAATSRAWTRPGARSIPRPPPNDEPPHQRPIEEPVVLPPLALVAPTHRVPGALLASDDGARVLFRVTTDAAVPGPVVVAPVAPVESSVSPASSSGGRGAEPPRNAPPVAGPPSGAPTAVASPPALPEGLAVYDLASGRAVALASSAGAAAPFAVSPDGARVAAWSGERLNVWDAATGALLGRVAVSRPRAVALLGGRIAVAAEDGKAYAGTLERVRVVPAAAGVTAIALDPFHADRVAIGTEDGGVRVVEARTGASLGAWGVHAGALSALVFSQDGRLLASAGPRPGADGGRLVVLGTDRAAEDEEPWSAVLDAVPARLSFDAAGARLLARGPGRVNVVERAGVVLDLSANAVDAALADGGVRWLDSDGALRAAATTAALPRIPRGRPFARSDDFRFSVTVDGDRLAVWDDKSGRLLRELPPTGQAVTACQFDDAGTRLAVLYADASVEVYEVASGEALRNVPGPPPGAEPWLRFSDDGALLWVASGPRAVTAWEIATGTARERVELPGTGVAALDRSTARLRFVRFGGEGGEVWLDTFSSSPRRVTTAADGFRPLAVEPKGGWILAVQDGALVRLDAESGRRIGPVLAFPGDTPALASAISPDGAWIVAAYTSGLLRVWEVERGLAVASLGADARPAFGAKPGPIASLAFDAVGEIVTARDATGFPRLFEWRLSLEAPLVGLGAGPVLPSAEVTALAVSPDGATLYSAHGDGNSRAWNLGTGVQTSFFWAHAARVTTLAVTAGGTRLVSGSEDGTVRVFDTAVAVERAALSTFGDPVRRLAVTADGWTVAAVGDGGVVRTWDVARTKALRRWALDGALPDALALGPVRGAVRVSLADASEWALDPTTGAVAPGAGGPLPGGPPPVEDPDIVALRALAAALAPITAEVRTPDRRTYVTAGADGRIRLWDRETRALRATLRAMTDGSWVVDRADGTRYASESLRDGSSPLLYRPPPQ